MDRNNRKRILRRRWTIAGIITVIILTWLELWGVVLTLALTVGFLYVLVLGIRWLIGADLDAFGHPYKHPHTDNHESNDISDTMWDIYTTDQSIHQQDENFHDINK
jgi:fatty acid desaturase